MHHEEIAPNRSVLAFFVLAYICSWGIWLPALVVLSGTSQGLGLVIGTFGPAAAGAIMVSVNGGSPRSWIRDMMIWRVSGRWYAVAVGFPILLAALVTTGMWVLGSEFNWEIIPQRGGFYLGSFISAIIIGGGQEELGWRGYALPRLQRHYTAFTASLFIGIVWTFWHLPLFIFDHATYGTRPLGLYLVFAIGLSVVLTWLYNSTSGSVFLSAVLHAGVNSALLLIPLPLGTFAEAQTIVFTAQVAGVGIATVGLVAYYGRDTLASCAACDSVTTG